MDCNMARPLYCEDPIHSVQEMNLFIKLQTDKDLLTLRERGYYKINNLKMKLWALGDDEVMQIFHYFL